MTSFDCVLMLTWSDWKTESRSNRYHYAVRFANDVPVYFVQPDRRGSASDRLDVEATEVAGVTVVHVDARSSAARADAIADLLARDGRRQPLLWIYNPRFGDVIGRFPSSLSIYHATEDYFSSDLYPMPPRLPDKTALLREVYALQSSLLRTLDRCDGLVAVTDGVAESYASNGAFDAPLVVLPNGCDYAFWSQAQQPAAEPSGSALRIAAYHGGINGRLDASLILEITELMPDWEFRFYGPVDPRFDAWASIVARPNVRHFGTLPPEDLRRALPEASVGIMPYRQMRMSVDRMLPLKAFEYAAMGIPVVTIAMRSLPRDTPAFHIARTAAEFAARIRDVAPTRANPDILATRQALARTHDFDDNYTRLVVWLGGLNKSTARAGARRLGKRLLCEVRLRGVRIAHRALTLLTPATEALP